MNPNLYESLIASSFRFLSIRQRSRKELRVYLLKKVLKKDGSEQEKQTAIERVIERLVELGYVDDRKFTESLLLGRMGSKPKGPSVIKQELKQKGISERNIEAVFSAHADLMGTVAQRALAKKALGKRGEAFKKLPMLTCKRRVYNFLMSRGFSSLVIRDLVDDYCGKAYNRTQENTDI